MDSFPGHGGSKLSGPAPPQPPPLPARRTRLTVGDSPGDKREEKCLGGSRPRLASDDGAERAVLHEAAAAGGGAVHGEMPRGNWNEDQEMADTLLKDFLAKKATGTLKLDK